ncbi:aminopeptidase P N-terminal domain-containing protein [soil metagenome]
MNYGIGAPAGPPPAAVLNARREKLLGAIGDGIAVLAAAPQLHRSRDTEVIYRQDSNLYYLTGLAEPEAVAVLTPHDQEHRFTLFLRERDPEREAWNGPTLGLEGARERIGATAAYPISEMHGRLPDLLRPAPVIHFPFEHPRLQMLMPDMVARARSGRARSGLGPAATQDLELHLERMRLIKDEDEIARMRVTAAIAVRGHRALMAAARPGMGEWELQSIMEAEFRKLGAAGPAFPSIVGSGTGATVLHYVDNDQRLEERELVLVDAGAEWGMYCSDISRTFPVSGRFSEPQRELYEIVLAAQLAAISAAVPGAPITEVHQAALKELVPGMIRLGLLGATDPEAVLESGEYRRFYLHQTSHWLGLDVHDIGLYQGDDQPVILQPGMVLTVEPGLYVPANADDVPEQYRGIGIRIEDDVLITAEGNEVLTAELEKEAADVERVMRGNFEF